MIYVERLKSLNMYGHVLLWLSGASGIWKLPCGKSADFNRVGGYYFQGLTGHVGGRNVTTWKQGAASWWSRAAQIQSGNSSLALFCQIDSGTLAPPMKVIVCAISSVLSSDLSALWVGLPPLLPTVSPMNTTLRVLSSCFATDNTFTSLLPPDQSNRLGRVLILS